MKTYEVIWTLQAILSLRVVYDFIKKNRPEGAKNVVTELVSLGNSLSTLPFRYPIEPLLAKEPVVYRCAVKWNYKVIYTIDEQNVMIIKVFDTRRNPKELKT